MRIRPLGRTGLMVSELGFGCASWWGKRRFPERDARSLVHEAIDRGVTLFDTGAGYSDGEAEPRLGRALKGRDLAKLVIATKAGTFHADGRIMRDMRPVAIVESAERSLRRLGVEALGVLQLHGPSVNELDDEMLRTLEELKTRGIARSVGVNSFDPTVIAHATGLSVIDVVMVDFNVLRPERADVIASAAAAGKGVLAGMPLAMGHTRPLRARFRGPQDIWYLARALARHRNEFRRGLAFRFLHDRTDITGNQAALAYVLANDNVSAAVFGATRLKHLTENLEASGRGLPPDLLARIVETQRTSLT